ncbi:MAG TPA: hypothetical protein PKI70_04450 [Mesotoga sp.]|nr:hypothetical protein [Mesotoga sp.]
MSTIVHYDSMAHYIYFLVTSAVIGASVPFAVEFSNVDSLRYALSAFIQSEATLLALCVTLGAILPQVLSNKPRTSDLTLNYFDRDLIIILIIFSTSIIGSSLLIISLEDTSEAGFIREIGRFGLILLTISLGSLFPFARSEISKTAVSGQFRILLENVRINDFVGKSKPFDYSVTGIDKVLSTLKAITEEEDEITLRRCSYSIIKRCQLSLKKTRSRTKDPKLSSKLLYGLDSLANEVKNCRPNESLVVLSTARLLDVIDNNDTLHEKHRSVILNNERAYWERYAFCLLEISKSVGIAVVTVLETIQEAMFCLLQGNYASSIDSGDRSHFLELAREFFRKGVSNSRNSKTNTEMRTSFLATNLKLALIASLNIDNSKLSIFDEYLLGFLSTFFLPRRNLELVVKDQVKSFVNDANGQYYSELLHGFLKRSPQDDWLKKAHLSVLVSALREVEGDSQQ